MRESMFEDHEQPITPLQAYDASYWRNRAERTRTKAVQFSDRRLHDRFLKIAAEYDRLAERADRVTHAAGQLQSIEATDLA